MADIAGPVVVGDAGELEPHPAADTAADSITVRARNGERLLSFIILYFAARTGPLTEQWLSRLCNYSARATRCSVRLDRFGFANRSTTMIDRL
jgi:hypothetical protein